MPSHRKQTAKTATKGDASARIRKALAPEAIGVKNVATKDLIPNPHNPRMLFDKQPMDVLRDSITKVGVLVPLTVYRDPKRGAYVILDGQRRWMTAQEIGLSHVPVNQVAEPSLVQNIVTMFQIHKVREDWELMPTALKLEVLMSELQEKNENSLAALTGLDQAVVTRCKKLLSYSRDFQDLMLDPDPEKRIKADFFIELYVVRNDRFVNSLSWYEKDAFTWKMLDKYASGGLRSVTDFRLVKQHINNARRAGRDREISKRLREFMNDPSARVDSLNIPEADVSASARKALSSISTLFSVVDQIDVDEYYGEEALWKRLEELGELIRKKLREVDRRART